MAQVHRKPSQHTQLFFDSSSATPKFIQIALKTAKMKVKLADGAYPYNQCKALNEPVKPHVLPTLKTDRKDPGGLDQFILDTRKVNREQCQ